MSHIDPTDIRGQERAQADLDEKSRLHAKKALNDLKWVMSDKRGRRFMARLLDQAGMHRSSFDTNNASMAFKEGVRWFGTRLKEEVEEHCFDRYLEMLKESKET